MASSGIPVIEEEKRFRENFNRELIRSGGLISKVLKCTICDLRIRHHLVAARNIHSKLEVLICNYCSHHLRCLNRDASSNAGINEVNYCDWCGEDGNTFRLIPCNQQCSRKFCSKCVVQKVQKISGPVTRLRNNDWTCIICSPKDLWPLRAICAAAISYVEQLKTNNVRRQIIRTSGTNLLSNPNAANMSLRNVNTVNTRNRSRRAASFGSALNHQVQVSATISISPSNANRVRSSQQNSVLNVAVSVASNSPMVPSANSISTSITTTNNVLPCPGSVISKTPSKIEKYDYKSECVICMDGEVEVAFVPCGHVCICSTCVEKYEMIYPRACPICRVTYVSTMKIYM